MGIEVGSADTPRNEGPGRSPVPVISAADVELFHIHIGQDTWSNGPSGGQPGGLKAVEKLVLLSGAYVLVEDDAVGLLLGKAQFHTCSTILEITTDTVAQKGGDLEAFRRNCHGSQKEKKTGGQE